MGIHPLRLGGRRPTEAAGFGILPGVPKPLPALPNSFSRSIPFQPPVPIPGCWKSLAGLEIPSQVGFPALNPLGIDPIGIDPIGIDLIRIDPIGIDPLGIVEFGRWKGRGALWNVEAVGGSPQNPLGFTLSLGNAGKTGMEGLGRRPLLAGALGSSQLGPCSLLPLPLFPAAPTFPCPTAPFSRSSFSPSPAPTFPGPSSR